jgi:hypothetical protein
MAPSEETQKQREMWAHPDARLISRSMIKIIIKYTHVIMGCPANVVTWVGQVNHSKSGRYFFNNQPTMWTVFFGKKPLCEGNQFGEVPL